jgi:hypothetical protein
MDVLAAGWSHDHVKDRIAQLLVSSWINGLEVWSMKARYRVAASGIGIAASLVIVGLMAMVGCRATGMQEAVPDIVALVTPQVASSIDEKGLLGTAFQQQGEITAEDAIKLAVDWVRLYAPFLRENLEKQHGAPIKLANLHPCGRVFYASSSFEPLVGDVPGPVKRAYGSWWVMHLCESGPPKVYLAVSAGAGHLFDVHAGKRSVLQADAIRGSEYGWFGIPAGKTSQLLPTAEQVVQIVATWGGTRVAAVPELITTIGGPTWVRWKVEVERPVTARLSRSGSLKETQVLFVGPVLDIRAAGSDRVISNDRSTISVAGDAQLSEIDFSYVSEADLLLGVRNRSKPAKAHVRSDRPIYVEPVVRP